MKKDGINGRCGRYIIGICILGWCLLWGSLHAYAAAEDYLRAEELPVYHILKEQVMQIADGACDCTRVHLRYLDNADAQMNEMQSQEDTIIRMNSTLIRFDASSLGIDSICVSSISGKKYVSAAAKAAVEKKMSEILERILLALTVDCPMQLYWFQKNSGIWMDYSYLLSTSDGSDVLVISDLICAFSVNHDFAGTQPYFVDADKIAATQSARRSAESIAASAAGKSASEQLQFFKDRILELAQYDSAPGEDGISYELVSIFDGDPGTKAVCEAYAKAFQYLCDLSGLPDLHCMTVRGDVQIIDKADRTERTYPHTWNLVAYNQKVYLVDLTNCDDGSVGEPDLLYMCGYCSGDVQNGYLINIADDKEVIYHYDPAYQAFFPTEQLLLQMHVHEPVTVWENEKHASEREEGSYDEVIYCARCFRELTRKKIIVEKLPPKMDEGDKVQKEDPNDETYGNTLGNTEAAEINTGSIAEHSADVNNADKTDHDKNADIEADIEAEILQNNTDSNQMHGYGAWIASVLPMKRGSKVKALMIHGLRRGDVVVSYESSAKKIVKVSGTKKGKVTLTAGKNTGTAVITAHLRSGASLQMKVKVTKKDIRTNKLSVSLSAKNIKVGTKAKLTVCPDPVTSTEKIHYTVNKKSIISVSSNGTITAKKAGKAVITIRSGAVCTKIKVKVVHK